MLVGCNAQSSSDKSKERIRDNDGVYSYTTSEIKTLYIDVLSSELMPFYKASGDQLINGEKPSFPVYVFGEEGRTTIDYPVSGIIQIKGKNSYIDHYRSFKITLDNDDEINGQRIFMLYKYPTDPIKITMKLGMDFYSLFEDIVSMRTEFVRLYLKDSTSGSDGYIDYGLYIFAENVGGRFLKTHSLDRNGELYEIKNFDFSYETYINASEGERRRMLEYKNGEQPEKFEKMLKDINDSDNFEDAFNKYFNVDNYLTWLGSSILFGNYRASTRDFLLYSPTDSEKWYFLPMVTDQIFLEENDKGWSIPPKSFGGAGWFTNNKIHYQFLSDEDNRSKLQLKTQELLKVLDENTINKMLIDYKKALSSFLIEGPDSGFQKLSAKDTELRINHTYQVILDNYENFYENLNKPLPFEVGEPIFEKDHYELEWNEAISRSKVTYKLVISKDIDAQDILFETTTGDTYAMLPEELEGNLFIFLTAENNVGTQSANCFEKGATKSVWGAKQAMFTKYTVIRDRELVLD